ncbi:hypothetical protein CASFOL_010175 [Castilleja foliolosa]|uniref:F-box domain-containing protein n=1 Tax=Castilleja foliolosa TaxID=1961234 RepID=A0ABD3DVV1_9LAMI
MAGEGEIKFPEPIIQLLQSFLTGKEAARTAIVSKSWHNAWLTRPNLVFDDSHFKRTNIQNDDFRVYVNKTIKRYEQPNLKIESFKLFMRLYHYGCTGELAKELIVKALRFGATRLCLRLRPSNSFVLPDEVFGADNLVELSVSGGTIKLDNRVVIKCRSLRSLILDCNVCITINTVSKIVSSFPCIEKLTLLPNIHQEYLAAATAMAVGVVGNLIPRLRCLVLSYESFKALYLGDLLSRFTFLKDFTLYLKYSRKNIDTVFEEGIQISNSSLERIKLVLKYFQCSAEGRKPRVKFDVPSVRKFTFEGDVIPCLSFISTPPSREWESHVSIQCPQDGFSAFWFNELSELLTQLSQSKTHLHVCPDLETFGYKVGDKIIQSLRKHELENLTIDMTGQPSLSCYALFDGLFRLCRPKLITQSRRRRYRKRYMNYCYENENYTEITNIDFLCQILDQGINFKLSSPTQFMFGLNDLEEVSAQTLDMDNVPAEWRPIPFESLLDADTPYKYEQAQIRTRLLLKWKPI